MCSVQPFCSSTQPVRDGKRQSRALMVSSVMAAANTKCRHLLGLSFFAFPALVSAACFPDDCASCTQAECNLEPGCLDIYPGNFETSCVSCPNTTCLSDGGLDVTAGCSDGINVLVSLTMGLIGGLFAAGMPCICLSIRSQELWAAEFLDDRNTEMRRVRGVIKDKKNVDKRGGHAFSVIVEFVAEDLEQQQVPVRAHCASQPAFWSKVKVGGEVEIAYRAGLERDFVIVDDLLTYLMDTSSKYILCICGGGHDIRVGRLQELFCSQHSRTASKPLFQCSSEIPSPKQRHMPLTPTAPTGSMLGNKRTGQEDTDMRSKQSKRSCSIQHGVTVSDHGEKVTWSGYWDERQRKLESQTVDDVLFGTLSSRIARESPEAEHTSCSQIFKHCCIYFDGRVDIGGGISAYALSKVARLHGATVTPRLAKRSVTHVVCTQLSGAKERKALRDASSAHAVAQYVVQPSWITESVAAGRRLQERQFSLMTKISRRFGLNTLGSGHGGGSGHQHSTVRKGQQHMQGSPFQLQDSAKKDSAATTATFPDNRDGRDPQLVLISDSPPASLPSPQRAGDYFSPSKSPENPEMPPTALDSEEETELDSDAEQ
ncbi:REV1 [Symbiodinium sp. CCMP2456]|nr:REV1 [Symbiodinium sp. CCMP2456]